MIFLKRSYKSIVVIAGERISFAYDFPPFTRKEESS